MGHPATMFWAYQILVPGLAYNLCVSKLCCILDLALYTHIWEIFDALRVASFALTFDFQLILDNDFYISLHQK